MFHGLPASHWSFYPKGRFPYPKPRLRRPLLGDVLGCPCWLEGVQNQWFEFLAVPFLLLVETGQAR